MLAVNKFFKSITPEYFATKKKFQLTSNLVIFDGNINYVVFLGETLGTFVGPGTIGQVVTISSPEPLTGKYVVIQLNHCEQAQVLHMNEVTCSGKVKASYSVTIFLFGT